MPKHASRNAYDIISIGDATLDNFVKLHEASVNCDINKENCMLCLSYADKIPVERLDHVIGGNAANNAVGASRLGLSAASYTIVGEDKTGEEIKETLEANGVSCEYVEVDKGNASNYSVVLNYQSERTILVYHADRTYKLPKLKASEWTYLTSMGKGWESITDALVGQVKKRGIKLCFNPGTYQMKSGFKTLKPILEVTHVLFVNKEEAARILGNHKNIKSLLNAIHETGVKIAVITDGKNGSFAFDGKEYWNCGITKTESVERTGAGDSFAVGFVSALFHGKEIPEALRWGTMNSASVILKIGPQEGLLTRTKMQNWLQEHSYVKPEKF